METHGTGRSSAKNNGKEQSIPARLFPRGRERRVRVYVF